MRITKDNIESYLLDYTEGDLSESELYQLRVFLKENPQYVPEKGIDELIFLVPEQISFPSKDKLKKGVPDKNTHPAKTNFDFFAVAYLEGDLNAEQRIEFEKYLAQHPEMEKDFTLLSKSRLVGENIIFKGKNSLKKQQFGISVRFWVLIPLAIAASLALLLVIFSDRGKTVTVSESGNIKTEIHSLQDPVVASSEINERETGESPLKDNVKELSVSPVPSERSVQTFNRNDSQLLSDENKTQTASNNPEKEIVIQHRIDVGKMMAVNSVMQEFNPGQASIKPFTSEPYRPFTENQLDFEIARKDVGDFLEEIRNEDLSLLNIASHGIEGVNRLTGTEMKLLASRDDEGEISRFEFTSKRLKISAPVQKSKNSDEN